MVVRHVLSLLLLHDGTYAKGGVQLPCGGGGEAKSTGTICSVLFDKRDSEIFADLASEIVLDLSMPRHRRTPIMAWMRPP